MIMPGAIPINAPLTDEILENLKTGDRVLISGVIYSARDEAHKRMVELIGKGRKLPFEIKGQIIYYVGPTPPKPGMAIGSAGPTSGYRMDPYTPALLAKGLKGMIGKGVRSQEVKAAIVRHRAVYFAATGGAGALISRTIRKADIVAYEDLGTEAIRRMQVEDFPAIVVNDIYGNDLYEQGQKKYKKTIHPF
jgi:fumarate hydratase subunit beta